jgi:hypothetical protein
MSAAGALAEVTAWVEPALAGWRYLFSPSYRVRKHHGWRHERVGYAIFDVVGGIVGVAVSLALVVTAVLLLWAWAFNEM